MTAVNQSHEQTASGNGSGRARSRLALLSLLALGVVYGDIGTSPLYAVRECFQGRFGIAPNRVNLLGVLSLILWSLIAVISVKYLSFVLRADNDGEGGILALMELVRRVSKGNSRKLIITFGLFGAALLYGDGMITPAISVLSAIEGIEVASPAFRPYVIPVTIVILVALFSIQRIGTAGVGRLFGPIMLVWFSVIGAAGALAIRRAPEVLWAVNPWHGVVFFRQNGLQGLAILGIVFLVVTGGEALYADIGHFGVKPIRTGWYCCVLPSLLLNYFGQGALLLERAGEVTNPFYQMFPPWALYPVVVLATASTVIASQAIISGAFSLTFQAFRLGYLPNVAIRHTSSRQRGQIYIPVVNWMLLAATSGLVLAFRHSGNLAAAYGVAVTTTMLITTLLFFTVMRQIFGWSVAVSASVAGSFLVFDIAFFAANLDKIPEGGWFPLLVAGLIYIMMTTWQKGYALERRKGRNRILPIREFLQEIGGGGKYRRVPGQAVYLSSNARGTPLSVMRNLQHNRVLHQEVVIYTAVYVKRPRVHPEKHLKIEKLRQDIYRVVAYYGFMQETDVPLDLAEANRRENLGLDLDKVTYFLGGEIRVAESDVGMSRWRSWLYAFMARNQNRATHYFHLPRKQVFEIGTRIRV
jgi:KUP system potassium uptake protein